MFLEFVPQGLYGIIPLTQLGVNVLQLCLQELRGLFVDCDAVFRFGQGLL